MTKPINLVPYFDRLSVKQRAVLCRVINWHKENNNEQPWMHMGILPFCTRDEAVIALSLHAKVRPQEKGYRLHQEILAVLDVPGYGNEASVFQMYLDDKKVYRQFGPNPERGKVFNWLNKIQVTSGFTNRFGRGKPNTDVWVAPCVRLVKNAPGYYTVTVLSRCKNPVVEWLHANCG